MQQIGDVIKKIVKKRNLGTETRLSDEIVKDPEIQKFLQAHHNQINNEMIKKSMSNLYEFYLQKRNPDKVMAGYQPELFINTNAIDVRYAPTAAKVEQDRDRSAKQHLQLIDLPEALHDVKLSEIDINDNRSEAFGLIEKFLKEYPKNPHQKGIYLSGGFGVGKTYMLAGLANQVAALGKTVVFLHVPTFIAGLTSHFHDNSLQDEIRKVSTCDVLILDDIGAESLSQWSRDDVLGVILQARMDNVLPTFFSSNMDMKDLQKHFEETRNAIDPVKAARLMQRVKFLAKEVIVSGPDRRNFSN
ncbi:MULTISPECIES: primosomal protein DnaI [Lactobacillus]|uniref:Primosomal protein DnaI n=1 Tax=Lactobacillus xujianguonis TaxID=2495899 RepID=A0A437SUJ0_9LACO|nr:MULTISPECIES: primosomal protein DnaI [Lactobacillus]RVU70564.1 primosomal protein DnaI [Lactobacillus xujianguonis]RVU73811.1 primosomal protein DnaI [Lactobacillus xujianguonis]